MSFDNRDTTSFMYILHDLVNDPANYLLPTSESYRINPYKKLLGYFDEEYIYLIPSVVIGMCDDYMTRHRLDPLNMQLVLNTLFRANLIKVGWVMRKDIRYRPEKRIGGKRHRYITFIRREMRLGKETC